MFDNQVEEILQYVNNENPFRTTNESFAFMEEDENETLEESKGPWKDKGIWKDKGPWPEQKLRNNTPSNNYRSGKGYGSHKEGTTRYLKNPKEFLSILKNIDRYPLPVELEISLYNPRTLDRFNLILYKVSSDNIVHFDVHTIQVIGQNKLNGDEFDDLKRNYGKYNSLKTRDNHLTYRDHTIMGAYNKIQRALKVLTDRGWVGLGENENPYEGVFEKLNIQEWDSEEEKKAYFRNYYHNKRKEKAAKYYQDNKETLKANANKNYVPKEKKSEEELDSRYKAQRDYYNKNKENKQSYYQSRKADIAAKNFEKRLLSKDDLFDNTPLEDIDRFLPKGYQDFENTQQFFNHIQPDLDEFPRDGYIQFINPSNLKTAGVWVSIPNGNRAKLTLYTSRPFIYVRDGVRVKFVKWLENSSELNVIRNQIKEEDKGLRISYKETRAVKEQTLVGVFNLAKDVITKLQRVGFKVLPIDADARNFL